MLLSHLRNWCMHGQPNPSFAMRGWGVQWRQCQNVAVYCGQCLLPGQYLLQHQLTVDTPQLALCPHEKGQLNCRIKTRYNFKQKTTKLKQITFKVLKYANVIIALPHSQYQQHCQQTHKALLYYRTRRLHRLS